MTTGNGGLGGCIQYTDMTYGSDQGFATVGTNNGHDGNYGLPFYQKPEVVKDFAYRTMRKSIKQGKQIIKEFYGKKQKKSYYLGCSTGGRQGFREVQDIGTEFDGVIIGAPAIDFNNLNAWDGHFYPTIGKNTSQDFITPDQWTGLIHNDIMKKCDGLDGAIDNIIEDSFKCQYKANDLLCQSIPSKDCLTQKQVDIVNAVYSPLIASNGTLLYPRLTPGGTMAESVRFYFGGHVSAYSDWLEYVIYQDPNWDPLSFTQDQWSKPQSVDPAGISSFKGDLSKFKSSGAKLLHYHGSADGIISPENSPRYYDKVSKTMKLSNKQLDEFYRFFRISGMGHCSGGNGAHFIGNQYVNLGSYKPEENVLWAMVQWVEKGIAPEHIIGSALLNNTAGSPVDYKRKHCRYPRSNVFSGKGDVKDPNNWNCVYPKK
ncbi:hypothetical protein L7F22_053901 [Adiantum nelumboides]|nr:hypothetical protein [Adiantum nelumboides]